MSPNQRKLSDRAQYGWILGEGLRGCQLIHTFLWDTMPSIPAKWFRILWSYNLRRVGQWKQFLSSQDVVVRIRD